MPAPSQGSSGKPDRTIAILGPGQMGLVCAGMLCTSDAAGAQVVLWGHDRDELDRLDQTRQSPRLHGFHLSPQVAIVRRDQDLARAHLIVSAIPVQFIRPVWERIAPHVRPDAGVVSVAKGIETATLLRPTQVMREVLARAWPDAPDPSQRLATLSGPTIASELARCLPAAMIVASENPALAARVQSLFASSWLRVYTHHDVLGVELAGAVKNVIAIAAGICDGLQAGCNAKSALLARGLSEIVRLGSAVGAQPQTFFGIAGVGDLATTCFSPEGRNRSCGEALGRGRTLADYLRASPHVVEGVDTCRGVLALARTHGVDMPIVQAVHAVLFEEMDPIDAIGRLMTREQKAERVG